MFKPIRTSHPAIKIINNSLINLPAPPNISIWWNYGSLLGLCLIIQIITGLFLAIHYTPNVELAFSSVVHISQDVNYGWIIRHIHANCASLFFLFLYLHIGRGIYYQSFILIETWNIGVIIFIVTMATAFIGYVLPWGQIRFWGASDHKPIFSNSLYWINFSRMIMRRFRSRQRNTQPIFCFTLHSSIRNLCTNNYPPSISSPNRIYKPNRIKCRLRSYSISLILFNQRFSRILICPNLIYNINLIQPKYIYRPRKFPTI